MNPYVPVECNLFGDPRVFKIATKLGVLEASVVGAFVRFWSMAYTHGEAHKNCKVDVRIPHYTRTQFEKDLNMPGVVAAMVEVGWCKEDEDGSLVMPRGKEQFSALHRERLRKYEREKKRRLRSRTCPGTNRDMSRVSLGSISSSSSKAKQHLQPSKETAAAEQSAALLPATDAARVSAPGEDAASLPDALPPDADAGRKRAALFSAGLDGRACTKYADNPRVTLAMVVDVADRVRRARGVRNRAGWIVRALEAKLAEAGGAQ